MNRISTKQLLGILGGMGPLASAEFLKTIYEFNIADVEQKSPACVLYSDPTFPDRTDIIISGSSDSFVRLLTTSLETLCLLGASKVVIPCVTAHYFLPRIPVSLRDKIISLIDVTIEQIFRAKTQHLLLCTNGTNRAGIFKRHERWKAVEQYVLIPDEYDQNRVHNLIYRLKKNCIDDSLIRCLGTLLEKYHVDSFIAGCTELHLLTKRLPHLASGKNYQVVDPLLIVAKNLSTYLNAERATGPLQRVSRKRTGDGIFIACQVTPPNARRKVRQTPRTNSTAR
jgi:aspartate racemase